MLKNKEERKNIREESRKSSKVFLFFLGPHWDLHTKQSKFVISISSIHNHLCFCARNHDRLDISSIVIGYPFHHGWMGTPVRMSSPNCIETKIHGTLKVRISETKILKLSKVQRQCH